MQLRKNMTNLEIAELLRAVAASYQLKDEEKNRFRIIAYQRAADATEHATSELKDLWDDGKLEGVPGIGKSIARHLDELFRTGGSRRFEEVMKGLPKAMFDLMQVPGIGVKRAYRLVKELKLDSGRVGLEELEKAAKKGKIARLEGFGEETEKDILRGINEMKGRIKRHLLPYATLIAAEVIEWMMKNKFVKRVDPLGSLRRQAATVGDIDIAVASDKASHVLEHFVKFPKARRVIEKGERTASIVVPGDVQVDLMVQAENAYGALLQHFTGSKHHNIALREHAIKHGMSLSEYGIKKKIGNARLLTSIRRSGPDGQGKWKMEKYASEEDFYNTLGMEWIPPELREDSGEIETAFKHKLPKLLSYEDIKGDLQIHSDFDIETSHDLGESSMEEIIQKANELGYEYIAFTEHNPSKSKHSPRQIADLLKRKKEKVDHLNYSTVKSMKSRLKKVFNSLEIDILPDGGLPVSEHGIAFLDFALVSLHSSFRLTKDEMTNRVLSALSHPKVKIFAHPTARKLNMREGVELDWPKIFEFCEKNDKWLEINADPMRLDLPDVLVREAVKTGVKLTLGTDSHHKDGLNNMVWGVSVARRGWAEKKNIVNTRSLEEFQEMIKP